MNPFQWRRTVSTIRRAGTIANWLHNLALFSALDFERFDEEWFWRELRRLEEQHPEYALNHIREQFDIKVSKPPDPT